MQNLRKYQPKVLETPNPKTSKNCVLFYILVLPQTSARCSPQSFVFFSGTARGFADFCKNIANTLRTHQKTDCKSGNVRRTYRNPGKLKNPRFWQCFSYELQRNANRPASLQRESGSRDPRASLVNLKYVESAAHIKKGKTRKAEIPSEIEVKGLRIRNPQPLNSRKI